MLRCRLGLRFCINRQCAIKLACFASGDLSGALRRSGRSAGDSGQQESLNTTWLQLSGEEDWAAWGARPCEVPSQRTLGSLLHVEIVYQSLSHDSKVLFPGNPKHPNPRVMGGWGLRLLWVCDKIVLRKRSRTSATFACALFLLDVGAPKPPGPLRADGLWST